MARGENGSEVTQSVVLKVENNGEKPLLMETGAVAAEDVVGVKSHTDVTGNRIFISISRQALANPIKTPTKSSSCCRAKDASGTGRTNVIETWRPSLATLNLKLQVTNRTLANPLEHPPSISNKVLLQCLYRVACGTGRTGVSSWGGGRSLRRSVTLIIKLLASNRTL